MAARPQALRMLDQALEPRQLVIELRPGLRIAVRQIRAADDDPLPRRLKITALLVLRTARQLALAHARVRALREDRPPFPRLLPPPQRPISRIADRFDRQPRLGRLQLLQADDIRRFFLQPLQQMLEPRGYAVHVESRELHSGLTPAELLAELCNEALHGLGLATDAQEHALAIGALLKHRTGFEDVPALLLRRPGEEELGLDEALLEERLDRLAEPRDVGLAARADHDASGILCEQRCLVAGAVDLVEDDEARQVLRADLVGHFLRHRELALEAGIACIDDVGEQ